MAHTTRISVPDAPGARKLWDVVEGLGVPFGYERSFRIGRGSILANRFLLSVAKGALGARPNATVLDVCRRLGLPESALTSVAQALPAAWFVHFGFEEGRTGCLYKVYLETGLPAGQPPGPDPVLLHRALKWDPADASRRVLTRYLWYPGLAIPDLLGRLARVYEDPEADVGFEATRTVVLLAAQRAGPQGVRYLEVVEEGNPRRSFDVNLYPAGLTVGDVSAQLSRVAEGFAIPGGLAGPLFGALRDRVVGHLAGGIHRGGEEFFTVYHGVEAHGDEIGEKA